MSDTDPRLWLEDVDGERALDWVRAGNAEAEDRIGADPGFAALQQRLLAIFDAEDKIPYVGLRSGGRYTNLWRDADNPRGLWRTTTLDSYATDEPAWETLLDLDALGAAEGESWVWGGATDLHDSDRCLIALSRGGADATVTREFDMGAKAWVEGGFELPEAKGGCSWIDAETVFVQTDFGLGSMTDSGYPRQVKRWRRGTPLAEAELVFEGEAADIACTGWFERSNGRSFVHRSLTFYTNRLYELQGGQAVQVPKPDSARAYVHGSRLFLELRNDYHEGDQRFAAGSLLATDYAVWMAGERALEPLFTPTERCSLGSVSFTPTRVVLQLLDNVCSRIEVLTPGADGWQRSALDGLPALGQIMAWPEDEQASEAIWLDTTDFLTPSQLWRADLATGELVALKQAPSTFDSSGLAVSQHEVASADGTRIPYFVVAPESPPEGGAPTLMHGYGGFEVPLLPRYSGAVGAGWLEPGGVYVVANIRGGGEFGPAWHQAALRENRQRAYDDFVAVGDDLVARGLCTRQQLGIIGGSNGGLLMGNMLVQFPERWGAIVCQVPLLDMQRYHLLLAGASWMAEYGDPDDPEDWAFLQRYSPYHHIDPDATYPPILLTTSTRDDRVHPGHARKMAHALAEAGHDVTYYENIEGGHGGAADNKQAAKLWALAYTYLKQQLGRGE